MNIERSWVAQRWTKSVIRNQTCKQARKSDDKENVSFVEQSGSGIDFTRKSIDVIGHTFLGKGDLGVGVSSSKMSIYLLAFIIRTVFFRSPS